MLPPPPPPPHVGLPVGGADEDGDAARAPSAAESAAFANAPTVYIEWHATAKLEGLSLTVDGIQEKRDMDGDELLHVDLTVRAGDKIEQLFFRDERTPRFFAGHWILFRGGSRQAAGFAVVRAARS